MTSSLIHYGQGAGKSFDPSKLPGLRLWYRADLGVSVRVGPPGATTFVTAWADQSGVGDPNQDLVASFAAEQPILRPIVVAYNNQPAVQFLPSLSVFMKAGFFAPFAPIPDPWTVFMVGNDDGSGARQFFFSTTGGGGSNFERLGPDLYNGNLIAPGVPSTVASLIAGESNGPSSSVYINSRSPVSVGDNLTPSNFTGLFLGSNVGSGLFLNGYLAEFFLYARILLASEKKTAIDYLVSRYALTVTP